MSFLRFTLILAAMTFLVGCQTTTPPDFTMPELQHPLKRLKRGVAYAIPGGVKGASENGRTFTSHYITLEGQKWDILSTLKQRAYAEVTILGDRRPYVIEIRVPVQERKTSDPADTKFEDVRQSKKLAQVVAQKLRYYLENDKRNLIDDFRPF